MVLLFICNVNQNLIDLMEFGIFSKGQSLFSKNLNTFLTSSTALQGCASSAA